MIVLIRHAFFATLVILIAAGFARQNTGPEVAEMHFGLDIRNHQPVETGDLFPDSTERIFCFTRITGVADTTTITHVWKHNGKVLAEVPLRVKSADWRTWSSKRIMPAWTGKWMVSVVSAQGDTLETKDFAITKSIPDVQ